MLVAASSVRCSAGKGFGDAAQPRKGGGKNVKQRKDVAGVKSADSKAVQRAVQIVEEQDAKEQQRAPLSRPVDPREASRGKVEYVRIKDWGTGNREDLGELQVDSEATKTFQAGAEGEDGMPFHEALARRLEMLQTQGALGVAQPKGGKPLPSFERWAFAEAHYVQYLGDMHAVHAALEGSIAQAAGIQREALAAAAAGQGERHAQLLQFLGLFGPEQGLDRASALQQDLQHIAARSQQAQPQQAEQTAAETAASSGGGGAGESFTPAPATQHAAAYAAYIASLGRMCRAAEGPQEEEEAVLRLLAHAYIVHLMQVTSGGRVAAVAADKLGLLSIDALAFYTSYPYLPSEVRALDRFVGNTNQLGLLLSGDQQETLMQELAKAMTKSSMLLVPLAREA